MELPEDWFVEHDGQRLVLDPDKVSAEIERLRAALTRARNTMSGFKLRSAGEKVARSNAVDAMNRALGEIC